MTNRAGCQRTTTDIDGQLQQAGRPTPQGDVVQTWLGTARSPTSAYRRNGSRTARVTGRNGGRTRIAHPLTVRSQIHADLCTDLAGHAGKQTSDLCRPVLFGAQNATICAPKLVITEELPATHIGGFARACPLADSHGPLTVAPSDTAVDRRVRFGQDGGAVSAVVIGRAHGAVPPDRQIARWVTARPVRKRASARWLSGPDASNGCTRLDRRLELVAHQCALRRRDLYVYRRLTGFSRLRTPAAPSHVNAARTARRIRFRSAPGPEAGAQE